MAKLHIVAASLAVALLLVLIYRRRAIKPNDIPPGPPGSDHSKLIETERWKTFRGWNNEYGPVASFSIGKNPHLVLGTIEAAVDILEKASDVFSSRPNLIMGQFLHSRLRGFSMEYGPKWRTWRTIQGSMFAPTVAPKAKPMQLHESAVLMYDYLMNEDVSKQHKILRRFTASLMFLLGYGRRVTSLDDPLCVAHDNVEEYIESTRVPGKYLIESWPILLWLPRALQWFRVEAEKYRTFNTNLYLTPMNEVKRKREEGVAVPCTATYALDKQKELGFDDVELAYALSAPWAAGIGTVGRSSKPATSHVDDTADDNSLRDRNSYVLRQFPRPTIAYKGLVALLNFPECLEKARAEIDSVVGADRMPDFNDEQFLPYLGGLIRESLRSAKILAVKSPPTLILTTRWRLVTPTGIAHTSTKDYTYKGMFIPKDTTVYANEWGIVLDPEVFPEGDKFMPERFVNTTDARLISYKFGCFGFGRRICPGMHVALQSLYIVLARMIWAFEILPTVVDGKPYIPDVDDFTTGLVSKPANLKYRLMPRSDGRKQVIMSEREIAVAAMAHLDG